MNDAAMFEYTTPVRYPYHLSESSPSLGAAARREWAVTAMRSWIESNLPRFMPAAIQPTVLGVAATDLALTLFLIVHPDSPVYGTPVETWSRRMANRLFARLGDPSPSDGCANLATSDHAFAALAKATGRTYCASAEVTAPVGRDIVIDDSTVHIARAVTGLPPQELDLWLQMDDALGQMRAGRNHILCRKAARDLFSAVLSLTQFGTRRGQVPEATRSAIKSMAGWQANKYLSFGDPASAADILLSHAWACEGPPDFHAMQELIAQVSRDGYVAGPEISLGNASTDFASQWSPTLAVFRAMVLCAPSRPEGSPC